MCTSWMPAPFGSERTIAESANSKTNTIRDDDYWQPIIMERPWMLPQIKCSGIWDDLGRVRNKSKLKAEHEE